MGIRLILAAGASLLAALGWTAPASADTWRWPLVGQSMVARGFDPPPLPWQAGHRGVDLRARVGDRVVAAGAGVVGYAGLLAGRGVVTVQHPGGLKTTYEPVDPTVHRGDRVAAGQSLGHVTGGHGTCGVGFVCLHWGLRRGTTYLDPLHLVRSTQVRLLPIFERAPPPPRVEQLAPPISAADDARPRGNATSPLSAATLGLTGLGLAGLGAVIAARRAGG